MAWQQRENLNASTHRRPTSTGLSSSAIKFAADVF